MSLLSNILNRFLSLTKPHAVAVAVILLYAASHIYMLNAPPNGYHQWRESDTAAITLNYYQEDMTFLNPRVNQRGDSEGITGIEFPLYNYVAALIYHVTGPSHAAHRALTVLAACISLGFIFLVGRRLYNPWIGAMACWALACSPLFFFYGFKIMPDMWMLAYMLVSIYAFLRWRDAGTIWWLVLSSAALVFSATVKPLCLAALFPFAYYTFTYRDRKNAIFATIAALAVVFIAYAWFQYGRAVNALYESPGFDLGDSLGQFPDHLFRAVFFKKLFLQWPWELWIGWVLVPICIAGLIEGIRRGEKALWLWFLGTYLAFAITASHSSSHDYYTLPIVVPVCLTTALGMGYLWRGFRPLRWLFVSMCVAAPIVTAVRISHRLADVPEFETIRKEADTIIPEDARVVVQERTTAIRLYQMNRRGFVIRNKQSISAASYGLSRGATFLVTERQYDNLKDSLPDFQFRSPRRIDSLYCYERIRNVAK